MATSECSVHVTGQDTQSSAVRSPHTPSSFVPDPELFRGVTPVAASRPDCATLSFSKASVSKLPLSSDSGMVGRVLSLLRMLPGKKKKGPAAVPAQQPQEPDQLQPLQDGELQSWAAGLVLTARLAPCHAMPCHAMPCHAMPSHPMPCHAMPCHAMPCHAMPCHAMPCHAMPCHAIPSHPIPSHPISSHPIPSHCHCPHNLSRGCDGSFNRRVQKTTARDQKFCSAASGKAFY